ncbi:MAG TPA: hypothetical protein VFM28_01430 [Nitrososphaeraceae archaeon]|nr:hypothetical protein [Nitrososphaeraceae archaeon]
MPSCEEFEISMLYIFSVSLAMGLLPLSSAPFTVTKSFVGSF